MSSLGTGRGCGLVGQCGTQHGSQRTGHRPGQAFKMLGESMHDRRADGPTYPGDERFESEQGSCCEGGTEALAHEPRRVMRHVIRRHPRHADHYLAPGQHRRAVRRVVRHGGGGVGVPHTGRGWSWDPSTRRWHHHVVHHSGHWVRGVPNYHVHHVPPPPPPAYAQHVRHLVPAPSVHHAGHWGWSPTLHRYAWIGAHATVGAINPMRFPPAQRAAINAAMKSQAHAVHAHTVWGATGARELFIPGHWEWSHVNKCWTYAEPHADQLGRPTTTRYPAHLAPVAAYGRRPAHIAPQEFWPREDGVFANALGQTPNNAGLRVAPPAYVHHARQNGLLSADHINQVRSMAWSSPTSGTAGPGALNQINTMVHRQNNNVLRRASNHPGFS